MGIEPASPTSPTSPPGLQPAAHSGRKGSKKVRTGCITCKIRKVKCDEAKPRCQRCTKTGRRCDGYLDAKTMAQRRRRGVTSAINHSVHVGMPGDRFQGPHPYLPPSAGLPLDWASSDEERAFHFFRHVTAPSLAGDFDATFWSYVVLQICQAEPAVRHAVLAVSSLHEDMIRRSLARPDSSQPSPQAPTFDGLPPEGDFGVGRDRQGFALGQYNKAIACLLDQVRDVDNKPLVPLLTCTLFICIEFMQHKEKESLIHLEQARQILDRVGRSEAAVAGRLPEMDLIKQFLVPIYTRLSLTSFLYGGNPIAIPATLRIFTDVPFMFTSLDHVRNALCETMDECLRFNKRASEAKFDEAVSQDHVRALEAEQADLHRKLARFNSALCLYQASCKTAAAASGTLALIQIHAHVASVWISTALTTSELAYDDYVATFAAIIPLATSFIDDLEAPAWPDLDKVQSPFGQGPRDLLERADRQSAAGFSLDINVIAPLFYVASKCRHPLVRRAALDLLKRDPVRRENISQADIFASIAEHTIQLEEEHLQPVPSLAEAFEHPVKRNSRDGSLSPELRAAVELGLTADPVLSIIPVTVPAPPVLSPPYSLPSIRPAMPPSTDAGGSSRPFSSYAASFGTHPTAGPLGQPPFISPDDLSIPATALPSAKPLVTAVDPTVLGGISPSSEHGGGGGTGPGSQGSSPDTDIPQASAQAHSTPGNINNNRHYSIGNGHGGHRPAKSAYPLFSLSGPASVFSDDSGGSRGHGPPMLASSQLLSRCPESPFDVPEHLRVHQAVIDDEAEIGGLVSVFMLRKLRGPHADWDAQVKIVSVR